MTMMVVVLMIVFHLQNVDEVIGFSRVPWQLKNNEFYSAADSIMIFFCYRCLNSIYSSSNWQLCIKPATTSEMDRLQQNV